MKLVKTTKALCVLLVFLMGMTFSGSLFSSEDNRPWFPLTGSWSLFKYDYYPNQQVYYSPDHFIYYYPDGVDWKSWWKVPPWINLTRKVSIEINAPRPFWLHEEVKKKYPPDPGST